MIKKLRKAVLPVAGLGTRFLPATKATAKEMLPVVDKPLIQYAVEEARAAGIEQFCLVTGRGKTALVEHFVAHYANERRVPTPQIAADAMVALQSYEWPGNVRQLRNVVERTVILAPGDRIGRIDIDLLPPEVLGAPNDSGGGMGTSAIMGAPLKEARETFEREYLRVQIRRFSGNISRTASFIGMERSALHRKLKLLGITETREE